MRKLLTVCASLLALGGAAGGAQAHTILIPAQQGGIVPVTKLSLAQQAQFYKTNIVHAQSVVNVLAKTTIVKAQYWQSIVYPALDRQQQEELKFHRNLLKNATRNYNQIVAKENPWVVPQWFFNEAMCVHRGEGAWNDNTGNGYGGGLQFDVGTWNDAAAHSSGRLPYIGGANPLGKIAAMPPLEQIYGAYVIVVVEHHGWSQWPNTARACGLL